MNNFKKLISKNNTKIIDELICENIIEKLEEVCKEFEKEKMEDKVEQTKIRKETIKTVFDNYNKNTEFMGLYQPNLEEKSFLGYEAKNKIDEELSEVVKDTCMNIAKSQHGSETKIQIIDRMYNVIKVLKNFDYCKERLDKMQEIEKKKNKYNYTENER